MDQAPSEDQVLAALEEVVDPEIPVLSVVDLGIINAVRVQGNRVTVEATPTFVGCPALDLIGQAMERRLLALSGVEAATISWQLDRPWTSERITTRGRERLATMGIAGPPGGAADDPPACPYCRSGDTALLNMFGPTACRSLYYCSSCRNPFEGMKDLGPLC